MRSLFEARLEHLGPSDLVEITCACGHAEMLSATMLRTAGVQDHQTIVDLKWKLRCRECDERGKVAITIRWDGTQG
jgi:hypothetical protein